MKKKWKLQQKILLQAIYQLKIHRWAKGRLSCDFDA
jgi:hypothetical protein